MKKAKKLSNEQKVMVRVLLDRAGDGYTADDVATTFKINKSSFAAYKAHATMRRRGY